MTRTQAGSFKLSFREGVGFKRCARCKQVCYCSAECQTTAWKGHKNTCKPPQLPLGEVMANLRAGNSVDDWRGVLKLEDE
ncbi:hypothetical protein T484DRAFT_1846714 [Baffinella frigidus]|nr:hypothetical protein T484DRAFT_1846714 [Cryptophyta sp. CCMP2293]